MSKLNLLGAWNGGLEKFFAGNSAQSFMKTGLTAMAAGASCGAGDAKPKLADCVSTETRSDADARDIEVLIKQTYRDALAAGDTNTIIDAYTGDSVMEPLGFATATGKDNIRQVYDAIFSALVYDLQFTIDEVIVSGNYASVRSTSAGTVLNKATNETAPDANRELWLMQKVDGAWKIARYMFNKAGA